MCSKLWLPGIVFAAFWALAITFWRTSGYLQPLLLFGSIGTALALGLGLYATLRKKKKQHGRRLCPVTVFLTAGLDAGGQDRLRRRRGGWRGAARRE